MLMKSDKHRVKSRFRDLRMVQVRGLLDVAGGVLQVRFRLGVAEQHGVQINRFFGSTSPLASFIILMTSLLALLTFRGRSQNTHTHTHLLLQSDRIAGNNPDV